MWNEGDGVVMGGEVEGCENEWMEMIKLLSGNKVSRWHLYNLITLGEWQQQNCEIVESVWKTKFEKNYSNNLLS